MNRRPFFLLLCAWLCLAVLASAQAFGIARGFLCECSGRAEWTASDHCHGPHHADCHDDSVSHSRNDHAPGDSDGTHEHEAVRDEWQSLRTISMDAPAWVATLVAVSLWEQRTPALVARGLPVRHSVDATGPPPGVAVARTVVILI